MSRFSPDLYSLALTIRRDAKAEGAFLNGAIERVRRHRPVTIVTDKAHLYRRMTYEISHLYGPHFDSTRHIDRKRPGVQSEIRVINQLYDAA